MTAFPSSSEAIPEVADKVWTAMGGGQADLFYPDGFNGSWQVVSTLVNVEVPMGEEMLSNPKLAQRARADLNKPLVYEQRFVQGPTGRVIADRSYNVRQLTKASTGGADLISDIDWDANNPNNMRIYLTNGPRIVTRVTRRFEDEHPEEKRLETSEVVEQVFDSDDPLGAPRVKGSRCITKYKWRSEAQANGGPVIVATQVVSDFVTAFEGAERVLEAQGRPSLVYTYKLSFQRPQQ